MDDIEQITPPEVTEALRLIKEQWTVDDLITAASHLDAELRLEVYKTALATRFAWDMYA